MMCNTCPYRGLPAGVTSELIHIYPNGTKKTIGTEAGNVCHEKHSKPCVGSLQRAKLLKNGAKLSGDSIRVTISESFHAISLTRLGNVPRAKAPGCASNSR